MRRPDHDVAQAIDLHGEFRAAWDRLEIHAQDVHSTSDGSSYATAALLRWRRNPGELWAAGMILPIAEETEKAEECTTWATELTVTIWSSSARRLRGGRLCLNLHRTQLARPNLAQEIRMIIDHVDVLPRELVLEIPDQIGPDLCRAAVDTLGPLVEADEPAGREILAVTADNLHPLGYEIVAEAIERPGQLAAAIHCGIAWAQGYLFAKPELLV